MQATSPLAELNQFCQQIGAQHVQIIVHSPLPNMFSASASHCLLPTPVVVSGVYNTKQKAKHQLALEILPMLKHMWESRCTTFKTYRITENWFPRVVLSCVESEEDATTWLNLHATQFCIIGWDSERNPDTHVTSVIQIAVLYNTCPVHNIEDAVGHVMVWLCSNEQQLANWLLQHVRLLGTHPVWAIHPEQESVTVLQHIELRDITTDLNIQKKVYSSAAGARALAMNTLGWSIDKPHPLSLSDWSHQPLTTHQVQYAAWDAVLVSALATHIL